MGDLRTTKTYATVLASNPTPDLRTTKTYATVLASNPTPDLRTTKIYITVLCELSSTPTFNQNNCQQYFLG